MDFSTGKIDPEFNLVTRRYGDLMGLFQEVDPDLCPDTVIYQTYGGHDEQEGIKMLFGTTVLMPGNVAREPFMTRGHVHLKPERGELCLVLGGSGLLLLVSPDGQPSQEAMCTGSIHDIDGRLGHRVVNTGAEPLIYFVTWMSDCGHDYSRMTFPRVFLP